MRRTVMFVDDGILVIGEADAPAPAQAEFEAWLDVFAHAYALELLRFLYGREHRDD